LDSSELKTFRFLGVGFFLTILLSVTMFTRALPNKQASCCDGKCCKCPTPAAPKTPGRGKLGDFGY
jgi:hypothetical protein